jgi:hypothetical protein
LVIDAAAVTGLSSDRHFRHGNSTIDTFTCAAGVWFQCERTKTGNREHTPSAFNSHTGRTLQLVHVQNVGTSAVSGPVWLVLDDLTPGVALLDAAGTSGVLAPLGSPYVSVPLGGDGVLRPFETKTVALEFVGNGGADLQYNPRVLNVTPAP